MNPSRGRRLQAGIGWCLTIGSLVVIAWLTLFQTAGTPPRPSGGETLLTDVVLNLLLFVPLGLGMGLLGAGTRRALILGLLASTAIECSQFFLLPNRDAAWHDVLTNGAGALLGAFFVNAWEIRNRLTRVAGPVAAAGLALAWIAGAALMRPAAPSGVVWYGFWAHQLGNAVQFPGRILEFSLNNLPIPDGLIQQQAEFERLVAAPGALNTVTRIVIPPPYTGMAQLVGIMSPSGEELVSLWQDGERLLARVRLATTNVGLRTPWYQLAHGLRARPGDTLAIQLEADRRQVRLTVRGIDMDRVQSIPLAPDLFWASFVPWDYAVGGHPTGWPLLATALIFGVIGLCFTRYPAAGALVTLMALFLPSAVMGGAPAGWLTIGLALFTLLGGQVAGRHLEFHRD